MTANRERFTLTIEAGPDPLTRSQGINRNATYRLKLILKRMLRDHGFRCVRVGPEQTAPPKSDDAEPALRSSRRAARTRSPQTAEISTGAKIGD